jgi:hypothetical protein
MANKFFIEMNYLFNYLGLQRGFSDVVEHLQFEALILGFFGFLLGKLMETSVKLKLVAISTRTKKLQVDLMMSFLNKIYKEYVQCCIN